VHATTSASSSKQIISRQKMPWEAFDLAMGEVLVGCRVNAARSQGLSCKTKLSAIKHHRITEW